MGAENQELEAFLLLKQKWHFPTENSSLKLSLIILNSHNYQKEKAGGTNSRILVTTGERISSLLRFLPKMSFFTVSLKVDLIDINIWFSI